MSYVKEFEGRSASGFIVHNNEWVRLQNAFKCAYGNPNSMMSKIVKVYDIKRTPRYITDMKLPRIFDKVEKEFRCWGFVQDFHFGLGKPRIKVRKVFPHKDPEQQHRAVISKLVLWVTEDCLEVVENPFTDIVRR